MTAEARHDDRPSPTPQGINRRRVVLGLIGLPVFFGLCLFWPAGDWTWLRGWLFVLVVVLLIAVVSLVLWRVNPEVVIARSHTHQGTKRWDKILLGFFLPSIWATVPVAAVDSGRFHWLPTPWWVCGLGYALLLTGFGLVTWAEAVNRFFEVTVRIQTERGHTVVENGPYAIIRHPGYVGGMLVAAGMALSLGSVWALIPATLASLLLVMRTHWEDETLQAELAGYRDYTNRVRHKLVPGIW